MANPENSIVLPVTVRYPDEKPPKVIDNLTERGIIVPSTHCQMSYCIGEKKISIEAEGDLPDIALRIIGRDVDTEFIVDRERREIFRFNLANEKWCGVKIGRRDQIKGDCANSNKKFSGLYGCLTLVQKEKVFLWKANNYRCYNTSREQHNCAEAWLCRKCASPKRDGMGLPCPKHKEGLCNPYPPSGKFELEPVLYN